MKIWVIGRNYPTPKNKMAGSFELDQAKMLAKMGNEVCYICCVFHPLYKVEHWGYIKWKEDISVYALSQFYAPQRMKIYLDKFKTKRWKFLLDKVEEDSGVPDIIHIHYPTMITVPAPILAYKRKGTKIIATEHWTKVQEKKLNHHETCQLCNYVHNADKFISVSKQLADSISYITKSKNEINVVPNMVPDIFCHKDRADHEFHFIAIGRLVGVKQFDKIIYSFYSAFHDDNNVKLEIVGGGKKYSKLKKLIQSLNMEKQIQLTGQLSREDTADRLSQADALICFSALETFGVPVIEAWYSGIPVITSDAIGFKEMVKKDLGILVSYTNNQSLKNAMLDIVSNYDNYSSEYIKNFAMEHFSEQAVYQCLMGLYNAD